MHLEDTRVIKSTFRRLPDQRPLSPTQGRDRDASALLALAAYGVDGRARGSRRQPSGNRADLLRCGFRDREEEAIQGAAGRHEAARAGSAG